MTREEICKRLEAVFSDVFDHEVKLSETTTAADVEDWDSLRHITLVGAIEDEFDVRFGMGDVVKMKNVGDMMTALEQKVK